MTATMITIGTLNPDGEVYLQRYAQAVIPLLEAAGVKIRGRFKGTEALVGDSFPDLVAVMDFPDINAMKTFLDSRAYRQALPDRQKAFQTIQTFATVALSSGCQ